MTNDLREPAPLRPSWWVRFTGTNGQELHTRVVHPGIAAAVVIAEAMRVKTDTRKPFIYYDKRSRGLSYDNNVFRCPVPFADDSVCNTVASFVTPDGVRSCWYHAPADVTLTISGHDDERDRP